MWREFNDRARHTSFLNLRQGLSSCPPPPSHQPLINSQWRSPRVSRPRKIRCNSSRSAAPLKGNQTTEALRLQLPSHLSPYAHRSHHVRRIIPSVFRHLQATRHATPACVFSCHVLIRSFSHSACLLHYPRANEEAHVSWFKAGEREKKKVKRNQRDAVSPSSKQDFLRATVLIDR